MDVCTVGYLDNILVYSDSLEDHQDHIHEVLCCLHTVGLYTNPKKCKFHMDTVEYLRFVLSPKGLQMDPTKASAILDCPKPLNPLCKKSTHWHFSVEEAKAFQNLKKAFESTPVLAHWAPDLPMTVETDASNCVIAGILSVTTEDGEI